MRLDKVCWTTTVALGVGLLFVHIHPGNLDIARFCVSFTLIVLADANFGGFAGIPLVSQGSYCLGIEPPAKSRFDQLPLNRA